MKIRSKYLKNLMEDIYLKHKWGCSVVISVIITLLFRFEIITNIKDSISNMTNLIAALMVVITLILTILLYLNDKEPFKKRFQDYGYNKIDIFYFIFKIIMTNILSTGILILIDIVRIDRYIIKILIAFCGSYIFSYMMLGTIYMLWFSIFIVIGIDEKEKKVS